LVPLKCEGQQVTCFIALAYSYASLLRLLRDHCDEDANYGRDRNPEPGERVRLPLGGKVDKDAEHRCDDCTHDEWQPSQS
jgi:hypothetical protein